MRDVITIQQCLSLAGRIPRLIPDPCSMMSATFEISLLRNTSSNNVVWSGQVTWHRTPRRSVRDHSAYGLRHWETLLPCHIVSHWLNLYPEWSLCAFCELVRFWCLISAWLCWHYICVVRILTYLYWGKLSGALQTTFSKSFSSMKIVLFGLKNTQVFLRVQFSTRQYCFK